MAARVVRGRRGLNSKLLLHDNFRYQYNRTYNNSMYWRCWRKDCRSRLTSSIANINNPPINIQVLQVNNHNHPREARSIEESDAVNEMKDTIITDPTIPVKRVYNATVSRTFQVAGAAGVQPPAIPDFHRIQSSLSRTKASQCPPIPANINQVNIVGEFARTFLGDRYLLLLDNNTGVATFCTDNELNVISQCDTLYVDGTFKTAPFPYKQIFTVHGVYSNRVVPLATALLSGKTQPHYDALFTNLMREVQRVQGNNPIAVNLIISDFEIAVINSLRLAFPGVRVGSCYFHFTQNLWKHVQSIGLSRAYDQDQFLHVCINHCFALGFLPVNDVVNSFVIFVNAAQTQQLIQQYPNLQNFFDYLWNSYVGPNSIFPIVLWNVYDRGMSKRTNNVVESYHGRWNSEVGIRHPNIWLLIRKMKDQQTLAHNTLINAQHGYPPVTRKLKWRNLERDINRMKADYQRGQQNVLQYWDRISHLMTNTR